LEGGEKIGKEEEFMWRGKERKMREAGKYSRKYGGRVSEAVVWFLIWIHLYNRGYRRKIH